MARLILEAIAEDTVAAPGNRQPCYIIVSVTDADGVPVTGLTADNLKVQAAIVGPGGAIVDINLIWGAATFPGFYNIHVVPTRDYTWAAGVYIFAVVATRASTRKGGGQDQGQTLVSVHMD